MAKRGLRSESRREPRFLCDSARELMIREAIPTILRARARVYMAFGQTDKKCCD